MTQTYLGRKLFCTLAQIVQRGVDVMELGELRFGLSRVGQLLLLTGSEKNEEGPRPVDAMSRGRVVQGRGVQGRGVPNVESLPYPPLAMSPENLTLWRARVTRETRPHTLARTRSLEPRYTRRQSRKPRHATDTSSTECPG